jgi:hypothetical protein
MPEINGTNMSNKAIIITPTPKGAFNYFDSVSL